MEFTYVLPGWEGSTADSRVLKDALFRTHPIRIPRGEGITYFNILNYESRLIMSFFFLSIFLGTYYLVDVGFTDGEGFLAPYRGQRYHLKE